MYRPLTTARLAESMTWHSFTDAWLRDSGLVVVVVGAAGVVRGAGVVVEATVVTTVALSGMTGVVVVVGTVVGAVAGPGRDDEQPAMISSPATVQMRNRVVGIIVH
jgi:hypothetical protein